MGEPEKWGLEAPKTPSLWVKGETWRCPWASKGYLHLKREEAESELQAPPVYALSPVPWHPKQQPFPEYSLCNGL